METQNKQAGLATVQDTPAQMAERSFNSITANITSFLDSGGLDLPANYSAQNALRSAWLQLSEQTVKVNDVERPVLEVCSKPSIMNSLLKMVVQGMNPSKTQCYFIPYKKGANVELQYQRSFGGSLALAKRVSSLVDIVANPIYKNDVFQFGVNNTTGRKYIVEHSTAMENQSAENVVGAYAIVSFADGSTQSVIKNIQEIRKAWEQGATKGASPAHRNFTAEMATKTVIANACKLLIMASSDENVFEDLEEFSEAPSAVQEVVEKSNKKEIGFSKKQDQIPQVELKQEKVQEKPIEVSSFEIEAEQPGY